MPTIACHTLGCKVNQYDTQAMEELLNAAGYKSVPFPDSADVYLLNTCTVTGTGDKKSLQIARKLKREHPGSILVLCGCMAQLQGANLFSAGADLIIGTQRRTEIAELLERVVRTRQPLCAVDPIPASLPFEALSVSRQSGHTRAILKIQEGCRNRCAYCIIPDVRGPIRSRLLPDIRAEASRLAEAGFCEIVLTGIHLSSWGKDLNSSSALPDVLGVLQEIPGIRRIRLGSLEPTVATEEFALILRELDKTCPHFHLALQSGSDSVLRRMRRRYNTDQYMQAVRNLRSVFPGVSLTTDILTGFPGETEEEFAETESFIRAVGFSRIHVFPYSSRPGTPAADFPGQLSETEKQSRARRLIGVGRCVARQYQSQWIGRPAEFLPEEVINGCWEGYTREYLRLRMPPGASCQSGVPVKVIIRENNQEMFGEIIP